MSRPLFGLMARMEARPEFVGFSHDAQRLWARLAGNVDAMTNTRGLHLIYGVAPSTFVSRLDRDGLPSASDLLCAMRRLRAGQLYGGTVAPVAYALDFASPQSMNRHFRQQLGCTAKVYLEAFDWLAAFDEFVATYYTPHREVWRDWTAVRRPSQLKAAA